MAEWRISVFTNLACCLYATSASVTGVSCVPTTLQCLPAGSERGHTASLCSGSSGRRSLGAWHGRWLTTKRWVEVLKQRDLARQSYPSTRFGEGRMLGLKSQIFAFMRCIMPAGHGQGAETKAAARGGRRANRRVPLENRAQEVKAPSTLLATGTSACPVPYWRRLLSFRAPSCPCSCSPSLVDHPMFNNPMNMAQICCSLHLHSAECVYHMTGTTREGAEESTGR